MSEKKSVVVLWWERGCLEIQCMQRLLLRRRNRPIKHGARFAHTAQVIEVADIQALMESAFDSPRLAVGKEGKEVGSCSLTFARLALVPLYHGRQKV